MALSYALELLEISDVKAISLSHKLVCETIRRSNLLEYIVNRLLHPLQLKSLDPSVRDFLKLCVYALKFEESSFGKMIKIVNIGRKILGWKAFLNVEEFFGKLLNLQMSSLLKNGLREEERLGLSTFNPTWFVKYCYKIFGRREALSFLESSMKVSPTYIRVNTLRMASEKKILKILKQEEIELEKVEHFRHTYKLLNTKKPLSRTSSFRKGLFCIQDKASCLATEVANPKPQMDIIDMCAAPGIKTSYMAQLMQNKGRIYSLDFSKRRMQVWRHMVHRMGVENAQPIVTDLRKPLPTCLSADIVTLDPPCTSTGTLSRVPSAKWRLSKGSAYKMSKLQWLMLENSVDHVKEGGVLIYSTCSITLQENEMLIEKFLKWHPEFILVEAEPKIGKPAFRGQNHCQRLYPHIHSCNGFFVAKLRKTG